MIVCFLGYLLAVSVFFTTFVHKNYVVLKMEKVYAHREFGLEANIIGCATYELKTGEFKTSYLGQLMGYLTLLDEKVRKRHENPSIGIVLCKSANREYVEFMIRDYSKPMGVATYKTADEMPENLRKALPDMEELKKLI